MTLVCQVKNRYRPLVFFCRSRINIKILDWRSVWDAHGNTNKNRHPTWMGSDFNFCRNLAFPFSLGLQSVSQACNPLSQRFSCTEGGVGSRSVVAMRATTHKIRQTCQGTRTQRVGGVRTGPWQRRHPTWMGSDFNFCRNLAFPFSLSLQSVS